MRTAKQPVANPGAGATVTIWDDGSKFQATTRAEELIRVVAYVDQDATLTVKTAAYGSTNLRTAATYTISANTWFNREIDIQPGRNVLTITTGTAPTIWEVSVDASDQIKN